MWDISFVECFCDLRVIRKIRNFFEGNSQFVVCQKIIGRSKAISLFGVLVREITKVNHIPYHNCLFEITYCFSNM